MNSEGDGPVRQRGYEVRCEAWLSRVAAGRGARAATRRR